MNGCHVVPGYSPDTPGEVLLQIRTDGDFAATIQLPPEMALRIGAVMSMIAEHVPALAEAKANGDDHYERVADRLGRRLACVEDYSVSVRRRVFDKRIDQYIRNASILMASLAAGIAFGTAAFVKGITILEIIKSTFVLLSDVSVVVLSGLVVVAWLRRLADRDDARAVVIACPPSPEPREPLEPWQEGYEDA